jgi:hypothetical protein
LIDAEFAESDADFPIALVGEVEEPDGEAAVGEFLFEDPDFVVGA